MSCQILARSQETRLSLAERKGRLGVNSPIGLLHTLADRGTRKGLGRAVMGAIMGCDQMWYHTT